MTEPEPRWTDAEVVEESLVADWRARLAHRYPPAADAPVLRAWAGLYDMTPDAHPLIGWAADGVYVACGFSGHGFMQAPAVGDVWPSSSARRPRSTSRTTDQSGSRRAPALRRR